MSTLLDELAEAANYAENCDAIEAAARLRKRIEHIRTLRGIDEAMGAEGNLRIIDAVVGPLP